jgi:hypothetical protein
MKSQTQALTLKYEPLSELAGLLLSNNPKLHDCQIIWESMCRYGFRDPMAFDATLGEFVEGNGRIEALLWAHDEGYKAPRGIIEDGGEWLVPVLHGVDARSKGEAIAYSIDHNALTLAGGSFSAEDMAKLWEVPVYQDNIEQLADWGSLPLSDFDIPDVSPIDYPDIDEPEPPNDGPQGSGVDGDKYPLAIVLSWAEQQQWEECKGRLGVKGDKTAFLKLIEGV